MFRFQRMMKETSSSLSKILALAYLQVIFLEFLSDSTDVIRVDRSLASVWDSVWREPLPEPMVGTSRLRVTSTKGALLPLLFQPPTLPLTLPTCNLPIIFPLSSILKIEYRRKAGFGQKQKKEVKPWKRKSILKKSLSPS